MLEKLHESVIVRIAPVLLAISVLVIILGATTKAQEVVDQVSISVSPQSLDLAINPGESVSNVFRLTNGSDESLTIQTIPKNFLPLGNEGAIELLEDDTPFSLASWISVSPEGAVPIEPGQTVDFNVTISAPANAEPGGHFGSVVFQTIPSEQDGTAALISQEIAPVILVKIPGDVDESGQISQFTSTRQFWTNQSDIGFDIVFENTGNVHYQPSGQVIIRNIFGREVDRLEVAGRNVIPGAERRLDTEWRDIGFRFGSYTAEVTLVHGTDSQLSNATTNFYVVPFQQLVPAVLVIGLVGYVVYRYRKRIRLAIKALTSSDEE